MFMELIGTFAAGLGVAGVILLLNKITRGLLPRWATPAGAGLAMLCMTVWMEMSWSDRTVQTLPDGVVVAETVSEKAWWRPWTYVWPQNTRLIAIDTRTVRSKAAMPDLRLVDLYLMGRWSPVNMVPQLIHCVTGKRADVSDAILANPDGADWLDLAPENQLIRLACQE